MKQLNYFLGLLLAAGFCSSCTAPVHVQLAGHYRFREERSLPQLKVQQDVSDEAPVLALNVYHNAISFSSSVNQPAQPQELNASVMQSIGIPSISLLNGAPLPAPSDLPASRVLPHLPDLNPNEDMQLVAVVVAIFLPFLGVLIYEGEVTSHFWIALLLTLLFWLPGFIYALLIILG